MRLRTGEDTGEEDARATVAAAADAGMTVFDTARSDGDNTATTRRCSRRLFLFDWLPDGSPQDLDAVAAALVVRGVRARRAGRLPASSE